jgi:uncharacterized protein (DUF302 family)
MGQAVVFQGSSDQVVAAVWSALVRRGYQLVCSFDLQNALAQHTQGCACPHHGTPQCTCQYVVLLAYPPNPGAAAPRVLTIHTYEHTTWVTLHHDRNIGGGESHVLLSALAEARARPETEPWSMGNCPTVPVQATGN